MGLQKSLGDLSDALTSVSDVTDSKQDTLSTTSELSLKSLIVGGTSLVSTQALVPILLDPQQKDLILEKFNAKV